MGFRDAQDWEAEKPPGERRIIVLGDSFTVAAGVPFAQSYTERLERRLQASRPAGSRLRVMNLAVGGYNDFTEGQIDRDRRIAMGALPALGLAWAEHAGALGAIAETARQHGIPVAAVLLPNTATDFAGQRSAHDGVLALCERIGMPCVDVLDGHPNAAYYDLVSSRLAAELAGWVDES